MSNPLEPLNDAARVVGNPSSTLLKSSVGNCFPGLEFDVRTLDRRFFPGLVFDFTGTLEAGPDGTQGAVLVQIEAYDDPMLEGDEDWVPALSAAFGGAAGNALGDGTWYLHALTQGGVRIEMYEYLYWQNSVTRVPYEGEIVWWIIRGLRPGEPLAIELTLRDAAGSPTGNPVILEGARRRFVNEDGLFDAIYRPGELTASMCSPWTHDFRDCTCHYWATNHPDVVMGAVEAGDALPDGESATDVAQGVTFLDWMRRRSEPGRDVSAATTIDEARKHRYDPYEINHRWQELDFVLEGREVAGPYPDPGRLRPREARTARPGETGYRSPADLIADLDGELAPLEMALAVEYLYALFSLRAPDEVGADEAAHLPGLRDALAAARQFMTLTVISEMTHLRWANQILWTLAHAGVDPKYRYEPVLRPAEHVFARPTKGRPDRGENKRPCELRPLSPDVLEDFVQVERPHGHVDTEYETVVRELQRTDRGYPPELYEIAVRIDTDGMKHYERFRDIQRVLAPYAEQDYLRPVKLAPPESTEGALQLYRELVTSLRTAYRAESRGRLADAEKGIRDARENMDSLNRECERLARQRLGVNFFHVRLHDDR